MIDIALVFLVSILVMAALARDSFVFAILYLFLGVYVLGRWWSQRALDSLKVHRRFDGYAFIGDVVRVQLEISNTSRLPLLWLRVQEFLPSEISQTGSYRKVESCGPRESIQLTYHLAPRYRGYYPVGPLRLQSGDLLGLAGTQTLEFPAEYLIVFPKIIPLSNTQLPPSSPIGVLRAQQPIFEDPNRPIGKRDYFVGDSQRRIDWKSSAASGRLQVKLFEPSIDMQVMVSLNLFEGDYQTKFKTAAVELAIVTAASIVNWTIERKINTGIHINGFDAAAAQNLLEPIAMSKGRTHLVRILEALARAKIGADQPIHELLHSEMTTLGWGTTFILITGQADDLLLAGLNRLRRRGVNVVLIICGAVKDYQMIASQARYAGITSYHFVNEQDLDIWRYR